jgi:hypothetical protein
MQSFKKVMLGGFIVAVASQALGACTYHHIIVDTTGNGDENPASVDAGSSDDSSAGSVNSGSTSSEGGASSGGGGGSSGAGGTSSGGGTSSSGGGSGGVNPIVDCNHIEAPANVAFCGCHVSRPGTGVPFFTTGGDCGDPPVPIVPTLPPGPPDLCCASPGFPELGDCNCYNASQWTCAGDGSSCSCGFGLFNAALAAAEGYTMTTRCNNAPGPDGKPWRCCTAPNNMQGECRCMEGLASCGSGIEVNDCSNNVVAAHPAPPPSSCPTGTKKVAYCQYTPTTSNNSCSSSADCPGGCSDDGSCCIICSGGRCVPFCG